MYIFTCVASSQWTAGLIGFGNKPGMASPCLGVCWIFCYYCKKRKPALEIWGEQDLFIFIENFSHIFWFYMVWSLVFSLHLMDFSLSWSFLVSCLLCTESILIFFYCNYFFPVDLFIYCLGLCQMTILSLSWLPVQVSFISRSIILLWRILSFLHSFFFLLCSSSSLL